MELFVAVFFFITVQGDIVSMRGQKSVPLEECTMMLKDDYEEAKAFVVAHNSGEIFVSEQALCRPAGEPA